jgi:phage internal scaffolding protein
MEKLMAKAKNLKDVQKKHTISSNFIKHQMRSRYAHPRSSVIVCDDGITEQHHAEKCDVNNILATYMKTGILPSIDPNAQYGDLSDFDYHSLQNQIANANSLFEQLPENVRSRFGNEPYRFLNFVQDEKNYDELVDMGLANNVPTTSPEDEALPVTDAAPEEQVLSDDTVAT